MKFVLELNGKKIEAEDRSLAEQANGSILIRCGGTMLLSTVVIGKKDREDLDFFPLTVEYEEKYYAAGKIKGSRFIKRESRPSDEAICNARLIDRAVRPRFPRHLAREVQIITTVLSWDGENDPDVLGLIAASIALSVSDVPWEGPVGAVRVGKVNGEFVLNPDYETRRNSKIDIVFAAALKNKEIVINMIEGQAEEAEEKTILEALDFSLESLEKIINFQKKIVKEIGKEKIIPTEPEKEIELEKEIKDFLRVNLEKAVFQKDKIERAKDLEKLKEELTAFVAERYPDEERKIRYSKSFFEEEISRLIHEKAIKEEKRADGRKLDELRDISCEVGLLPRTHGSGLFCRGKTKALSILTLGSPGDQQLLEGMEIVGKKRFMHHYNFPPYSVGEVRPVRGPGRREIGHGMLAEKALLPLIPDSEEFPYTIRIVSEMLSSNGSTSMASVSSSSLALMDAGVPIKRPAAGIAVGLAQDKKTGEYKLLSDIQGPEDHYGDMDFKAAGTRQGITVIQMDVKIKGINKEIVKEALARAKKARLKILESMEKTLPASRSVLSPYAPRIMTVRIKPERIGEVIGPGGKVINEIIDKTGASIDIDDSGLVFITSENEKSALEAADWIKNIVREVKAGETFNGVVKRILDFGAFVEILPGQEGMIHISKLAPYRVNKVEDVVKIGDKVFVKVIAIDEQGRINLSLLKNNSGK